MSSPQPKRSRKRAAPKAASRAASHSHSVETESQDILYFSSQAHADSYALQKDVQKLQTRVTRSRGRQIEAVQERIAALEAPVYKLSDDMLAQVFSLGAEGSKDTTFSELVSHVVSRWRCVALATPRLWTGIHVKALPRSSTPLRRLMVLADRASTHGLRLNIELEPYLTSEVALARRIVDFVFGNLLARCISVEYAGRCSAAGDVMPLSVFTESSTLERLIMPNHLPMICLSTLSKFPALEELSLRLGWTPGLLQHRTNELIILRSLRRLVLSVHSLSSGVRSELLDAFFPQLERLEIQLTHCKTLLSWFERVSSTSLTDHRFPALRILGFRLCQGVSIQGVTRLLCSLPSLRELFFSLYTTYYLDDSSYDSLSPDYLGSPMSVSVIFVESTKYFDAPNADLSLLEYWKSLQSADPRFKFGLVQIRQDSPLSKAAKSLLDSIANKWESLPYHSR